MTVQPFQSRPDIASGTSRFIRASLCLALAGVVTVGIISGCEDDKPVEVVEAPPAPPAPPSKPKETTIADLMAKFNIDDRVRMPEALAPDNDAARVAILQFFDGFVRGDATAVSGMLSLPDRLELEKLQKEGRWGPAIEKISRVDLRTGPNPKNAEAPPCVLAVFHTGNTFQPQLWSYELGGAAPEFVAEPQPPNLIDRVSGDDWIAAWFKILDDEMAKAEEPDEKVAIGSVNHDENEEAEEETFDGNPLRRKPGGGGGVPGRKKPSEPIAPPGLNPGGG